MSRRITHFYHLTDAEWRLAELLASIPCSLPDAALALAISEVVLRREVTTHRPDLMQRFDAARDAHRMGGNRAKNRSERGRQIAEVVEHFFTRPIIDPAENGDRHV